MSKILVLLEIYGRVSYFSMSKKKIETRGGNTTQCNENWNVNIIDNHNFPDIKQILLSKTETPKL